MQLQLFQPTIDLTEVILSYGINTDPKITFLLVNAYLTCNQQARGIRFFEKLLDTYQDTMADDVHAHHLSACAILRATNASLLAFFMPIAAVFLVSVYSVPQSSPENWRSGADKR